MSCILRIAGEHFDVDGFILKSEIASYKIFHKGEPKYVTKPDGTEFDRSGCAIQISKAEFNNFIGQVEDAIHYLKENSIKLESIYSATDIEYAVLDFGVSYEEDKFVQSKHLPNELLRIAADLGISIEISIYQPAE